MFLSRCFLLRWWLESIPPATAWWGTLGPFEVFWGLLRFSVVKTGQDLGHSEDYWGHLGSFDATDLFPGRYYINLSKKPMLGCYMYGRFLDRKGSGQTDQGEPRFSPKVASRAERPAIRQSWRAGEISPRGPGAMDGQPPCWRSCAPTPGNPSEAGIALNPRGPRSFFTCCYQYPNRLG
jgi:hypothetical protein